MSRYGGVHQALRRAGLASAFGKPCARCGRPMLPGQKLHLDHRDDEPGYRGFAHAQCNIVAGAKRGNARRRAKLKEKRMNLSPCSLGIEISEDRGHTSIVAAGELADGGGILVDLVHYLDGTLAVAEVLELRGEREIVAVAVDPRSPAATLIKPLGDAGVEITEPSAHDVAVAHGGFVDALRSGRLRHASQPELTAAVRAGSVRPLAGAQAWERRGQSTDVSPAMAAELALWAWLTRPSPRQPLAAWT